MRLEISLEYFTSPGENLYLVIAGGESVAMRYAAGGLWTVSLEKADDEKELEYSFELHRDGQCVRRDWGGHRVGIHSAREVIEGSDASTGSATDQAGSAADQKGSVTDQAGSAADQKGSAADQKGTTAGDIVIRERWQDRPEDSPLWTKAFTKVIFGRQRQSTPSAAGRHCNLTFTIPCAKVSKNETLAITGSGPLFDDWKRFIPMDPENAPFWNVSLNASEPFEYKFVILDAKTGGPKIWESGPNHLLAEIPAKGCRLDVRNVVPRFETAPWRGAGTAIPVFSLRGESSFGVGEFNDLKKLADWAALTGQSVIQILPVNDTTMTGTWKDSYPYNANSTFALHPQFIHLSDAGVKAGKNYIALRQELNSLPAVDYERVNHEKTRLLKEAFAVAGKDVMKSGEYKRFLSANKSWLIPYSVFSVLRDTSGTAEFSKWKVLSEYSESKVSSFRRRHKAETDFYCYVQFCLDKQLKDAIEYAHSKGVAIKGDLPIGISRTSVDAWMYPRLFNLDSQAGAPPDAFSTDGQNWGFPTYNWEEMAKDGYAWWKARLRKMSEYFDAFRIDHILGFFRIWEIPQGVRSGLEGHFNPALPYSAKELKAKGFEPESRLFV